MTPDQAEAILKPLAYILLGSLLAYWVSKTAEERGRRRWLWFTIALIANPIISYIILVILPSKAKEWEKEPAPIVAGDLAGEKPPS